MKKMVCDICESKRIKKENAVFVCQDCGTEYTLEEAKNLLKEIPESTITEAVKIENKQPEESFIKEKLYFWAEILKNIDICRFYYSFFENDDARLWENEELNAQLLLKSKGEYINLFAPLAKYGFSGFSILFDIDNTIERYKSYVMRNPNNREYSEKLNLLENSKNDLDIILSHNFIVQILNDKIKERFMFAEAKLLDSSNFPTFVDNSGYKWKPYGFVNEYFFPENNYNLKDYSLYLTQLYNSKPHIIVYKKKMFNSLPVDVEYKTSFDLISIQNKIESFANDINCQYYKFYNKIMTPIFEEAKEILLESIDLAQKLSKEFLLPLKYRKLEVVLKMIDLLESGNASTWKELVNAYDTFEYRETVKMSFEVLNQKFDKMTNCLQNINNNLQNINNNLVSINNQLSNISIKCSRIMNNTEKIKKNTFGILWEML